MWEGPEEETIGCPDDLQHVNHGLKLIKNSSRRCCELWVPEGGLYARR